jgi:3-methyladenine DNA glycosylase AlkD
MNLDQTMAALQKLGNEPTRKTWLAHGATGELYGVKIGDMKTLMKKLPKPGAERQELALGLFDTGNLDAMYFAGLLADGSKMTRKQLDAWIGAARWSMLAEYTVPWVACEHPQAREVALTWIDSKKEPVAAAGWYVYTGVVSTRPDAELDLAEIEQLLARVEKQTPAAPLRLRHAMGCFVVGVAGGVKPLFAKAKATAKRLAALPRPAPTAADRACKVPVALEMIEKLEKMGRVGRKRDTMKC